MNIGSYTFQEFKRLAENFHGYAAPGLLIGGYMVEMAKARIPEGTLFEAVVETRKCLPDAVQLLTLCSAGNNWMKVHNLGRYAVSLFDKHTGEGVRVSVDPAKLDAFPEIRGWFLKEKPKREQEPELLQKAEQVLFMPDLFAALLGAEPVCERSIVSTSQMLDPRTGQWSREVLAAYGLPENRFAPIVASGTVTGTLANGAKIIAVAGHDTQCASAAMPCAEEDAEHTAFLSCGTWSLLGTELDAPILTADSCQSGLSNELGANGKINYLKNIIGLWLIQESRREYKRRGQAYSFAELEQQALAAEPLRSFIDPDAPEFVAPSDLPGRIQEFCRKTGQPVPETVGAVMRCIYESLALKYRYAIEQLSAVTGRAFTTLHVLGGGTKDRLLCQMTADCCGLTVKAGPVEATALGNIMIQLKALGLLDSITQGRRLIAETEVIKTYTPSTQNYAEWNAAYDRFKTLL